MIFQNIRIRPGILLGELILGALAGMAIHYNLIEVATPAVVGIVALMPKLVESEEKTP